MIISLCLPGMGYAFEAGPDADDLAQMAAVDVVIIGETHDNPTHHVNQAQIVMAIKPTAIVVEMLTQVQAVELQKDRAGYGAVWDEAGWPDYAMYSPIFTGTDAVIYGAAVVRDVARATYADGVAAHFDGDVSTFGLDTPLPKDEHDQRLDLQFAAHCDAMPRTALGGMIDVQRLRDATLAKATLDALKATGGPIVVITGNGHARADWGVPSYLKRVQADVEVLTIGQAEGGAAPEGSFDLIYDAPSVDRPDPCDAFK